MVFSAVEEREGVYKDPEEDPVSNPYEIKLGKKLHIYKVIYLI